MNHDTDTQLASRVSAAIAEREVTPRPRWAFVAWNALYLFVAFLSVLLGALTLATFAYLLADRGFDVYREAGSRNALFTLRSLPYLWLAALALLVAATQAAVARTRRGYRLAPLTVLGGSLLASLALGSAFYALGTGERAHELARGNLPAYDMLVIGPARFWEHPESGFLSGIVIATSSAQFLVEDGNGTVWEVAYPDAMPDVDPGDFVRLIGSEEQGQEFSASSVRVIVP